MRIQKEYVMRQVAGEYIIVPVGDAAKDFNGLISVNEVGAFLWNHLREETDEETLVRQLLAEYEVDEATARQDVAEFVNKLRNAGILGNFGNLQK